MRLSSILRAGTGDQQDGGNGQTRSAWASVAPMVTPAALFSVGDVLHDTGELDGSCGRRGSDRDPASLAQCERQAAPLWLRFRRWSRRRSRPRR
jgi:hypothetical protein